MMLVLQHKLPHNVRLLAGFQYTLGRSTAVPPIAQHGLQQYQSQVSVGGPFNNNQTQTTVFVAL